MKKNIKKKKNLEILFLIILLLVLAISVGLYRVKTSDFNPINGDFQNYNPVRRLLAGQIPFKDFAVYLGSGHLFLISFFQLLIGNTFTKSLFITNMLTFLCFEILIFVLSFLILKDKKKSLYFTLFMAILNLLRPTFLTSLLNNQFISAFEIGASPGGSARLIRTFIVPLSICAIYLSQKLITKSSNPFIQENLDILKKISIAVIAGFTILWSNDGGIATYISISFIYFLLLIKEYKKKFLKIFLYTLLYIGISFLTFFIVVTLITRGNPFSWFTYTLGVSSYQKWYYLFATTKENINLLQIDLNFYKSLLLFITIYYMVRIFKEKQEKNVLFSALLSIFSLAILLSSFLYQFLSGGLLNEVLYLAVLVLLLSYVINFIMENCKNKKLFQYSKIILLIVGVILIISRENEILKYNRFRSNEANYVAGLNGYIKKEWDINNTLEKVGNDKVFSVYSTAINTATKTFQPSGIDYIIHVLGDNQRKEYLELFRKGDFRYVEDINPKTPDGWYGWIRNANWFFYRELYKNYKPAFSGDYNLFYEKKNFSEMDNSLEEINKIDISIEKLNDYKYQIKVKNNGKIENGIVDLKISYNSKFKFGFFKSLDINRYVSVVDYQQSTIYGAVFDTFNIPNKSNEYYIPITIVNGEGQVDITSYPYDNTELILEKAEIVDIFDSFQYILATSEKIENKENNKLYIDNTWQNRKNLMNVTKIKQNQNGIEAEVINYTESGNFIILEIEGDVSNFAYPYYFISLKED